MGQQAAGVGGVGAVGVDPQLRLEGVRRRHLQRVLQPVGADSARRGGRDRAGGDGRTALAPVVGAGRHLPDERDGQGEPGGDGGGDGGGDEEA